MQLTSLDRILWAASFIGQVLLLTVLFVRRRARSFPFFTLYIIESLAKTIVLSLIFWYCSFAVYRHSYWSLSILDEFLQCLVFYELAGHIFCPTGTWARDVHRAFLGLVGASVVVAFSLAWLAQPPTQQAIQTFVLRSDFFSSMLMSELFVGAVALSISAGLPWKTHVARIAQALGAYSLFCTAECIVANYVGLTGRGVYTRLSHLRILIYIACEAYWIVMLWLDAPAPRELPEKMRHQIYSLHKQVEYDLIKIRAWRRN